MAIAFRCYTVDRIPVASTSYNPTRPHPAVDRPNVGRSAIDRAKGILVVGRSSCPCMTDPLPHQKSLPERGWEPCPAPPCWIRPSYVDSLGQGWHHPHHPIGSDKDAHEPWEVGAHKGWCSGSRIFLSEIGFPSSVHSNRL